MKVIKSDGSMDTGASARPRGVVDREEVEAHEGARRVKDRAEDDARAIIAAARAQEQRIHDEAKARAKEEARVEVSAELARAKQQAALIIKGAEGEILAAYLPKQLSDDELQRIVDQAVEEANAAGAEGPRAMGAVMKIVNPKEAVQAAGGRVAAVVKQLLAG